MFRRNSKGLTAIAALSAALGACGDDPANGEVADAGEDAAMQQQFPTFTEQPLECERVVSSSDCDTSLRPIVFIHGTFGSATEISNTALLFGSNGYCQERFVAVEYNSLGGAPAEQLAGLVDQVLEDTGFDQIELIGHSQGTGHACTYLADPDNRAKVAHYINVSGGCAGEGVPTLSLSSPNDLRETTHHSSGDNVTQVTLTDEDHVALAGSKRAFTEMYSYLMGTPPEFTTVQCGDETVVLDGKAVTFGDNEPNGGGSIDVFQVSTLDSPWERGEPLMTVTPRDDGHVRFELERGVQYEFRGRAADGTTNGYIYFAPFKRDNYLMRFISASESPVVAAASTDHVNTGPKHMGLVGRYVGGAFRKDWNNSLKFDGDEVLTEENAPRNASVVGLFMYDANENEASDLGAVFNTSFLMGTDYFIDSTQPRWVQLEWTNEELQTVRMRIANWPSSENLTSLVLP